MCDLITWGDIWTKQFFDSAVAKYKQQKVIKNAIGSHIISLVGNIALKCKCSVSLMLKFIAVSLNIVNVAQLVESFSLCWKKN